MQARRQSGLGLKAALGEIFGLDWETGYDYSSISSESKLCQKAFRVLGADFRGEPTQLFMYRTKVERKQGKNLLCLRIYL